MSKPPFFLPMRDIAGQRKRRGDVNAAYAQVCSTGLQDATVTLFQKTLEAWKARPLDRSYEADLEGLLPGHVAEAARARLCGIPEFADPGLDADELGQRQAALTAVRAKGHVRHCRAAADVAGQAVEEAVARVRAGVQKAAASGPDRARQVVEQVRQALQELSFPPGDAEPYALLQRAVRALEQVRARRTALPARALEFVLAQLTAQGRAAYEGALAALAAELSAECCQRSLRALLGYLDALADRGADFSRRVRATLSELEDRQKAAARDQHVSRASVILRLQGPDEKQVLAGIVARTRCDDLNDLACRLLDAWEARLRDVAPKAWPWLDLSNAALADLVLAGDPAQLAAAFAGSVEESLGLGHTLYEVIAEYGVETCARFLYERSAPTCHLGARDVERFNVSPLLLAVARLPPPVGPRDHEIRATLAAALQKLGPCTIAEGAEADRNVTVVRLRVGWPIGIEEENRTLLERYLRAGERGHVPHLIGVLADSPLGAVSPRNKELSAP